MYENTNEDILQKSPYIHVFAIVYVGHPLESLEHFLFYIFMKFRFLEINDRPRIIWRVSQRIMNSVSISTSSFKSIAFTETNGSREQDIKHQKIKSISKIEFSRYFLLRYPSRFLLFYTRLRWTDDILK